MREREREREMVWTIVKGRLGEIWSRRSFDQSLSRSLLTNLFQLRFEGIIKQKKRGFWNSEMKKAMGWEAYRSSTKGGVVRIHGIG